MDDLERIYPPNAGLMERIAAYMELDLHDHAIELATLGDFLEDCIECELEWE